MRNFASSMQQVGRQMAMVGVASAIPMGLAVRRFAAFDDQMRAVRAVTQGTQADFESLTESAQRMASAGSFTAVEIGAIMLEIGKAFGAGTPAAQIEAATQSVMNLARATGTDAALASKILVSAMRQFKIAGTDSARIADALTIAANASLSSVESLGEALSYAGPVAAQFNLSIEDTLAVLGTLSNVGIEGSNAGTALRRMLILTGAEAEKMKEIFGVNALDAAGNIRPIVEVLDEVGRSLRGLGGGVQAQKLNEFFGLLGITGASAVAANIAGTRDLQRQLQAAGGTAARTAREMDAGLGGGIRRATTAVEGLAIAFGEALAPVLQIVGGYLESVLKSFKEWLKENKATAIAIAGTVVGVIALGAALIAIAIPIKLLAFGIGAITSLFSALMFVAGMAFATIKLGLLGIMSPFGLLIVALDGLRAYFLINAAAATNMTSRIGAGFRELAGIVTSAWGGINEAIQAGDLQGALELAGLGMRAAWASIVGSMTNIWRGFRDFFLDVLDEMIAKVAQFLAGLPAGFQLGLGGGLGGPAGANAAGVPQAVAGGGAISDQIAQDAEEARRRRQRERDLANAQTQAEADAIRDELEVARIMQQKRRRMEQIERDWALAEAGGPSALPNPDDIAAGMASAAGKAEAKGTFSAFAISGLGASSVTDRIARATEETARNTRNNAQPRFA